MPAASNRRRSAAITILLFGKSETIGPGVAGRATPPLRNAALAKGALCSRRRRNCGLLFKLLTAAGAALARGNGKGVLPAKSRLRATILLRPPAAHSPAPPYAPKALLRVIV